MKSTSGLAVLLAVSVLGCVAHSTAAPGNDAAAEAELAPVPFGPGMTRPVADPGNRKISYTPEAIAREVEGTLLVRCVITAAGAVKQCKAIKPLPVMAEVAVATIESWRFTPAQKDGQPLAVEYVFPVRLVLPGHARGDGPDGGSPRTSRR